MKKFYLLTLMMAFISLTFAQTKSGSIFNGVKFENKIKFKALNNSKAIGDTLIHYGLSDFLYDTTAIDTNLFDMLNEDIDGLTSHNSGWTNWMAYYSLDTSDFLHTDTVIDTAFYRAATSWFDPVGTSDDWLSFGPISVPDSGAKLMWATKVNPSYRDGYKVFVSTTGMDNYNDFTSPAIYTQTDAHPNPTNATDTIWSYKSVDIPASYNGASIYIGFQHYAVDMDVLYLDEITLIEANIPMGINEYTNGIILTQNCPNPSNHTTFIQYEIENKANVSLEIYDVTGRLVASYDKGKQLAGRYNITVNTENLNNGTYYYTLKADNNRLTKKMVIAE